MDQVLLEIFSFYVYYLPVGSHLIKLHTGSLVRWWRHVQLNFEFLFLFFIFLFFIFFWRSAGNQQPGIAFGWVWPDLIIAFPLVSMICCRVLVSALLYWHWHWHWDWHWSCNWCCGTIAIEHWLSLKYPVSVVLIQQSKQASKQGRKEERKNKQNQP